MQPLLYRDLTPWYRLIDPPEDHRDEAASYQAAFERGAKPRPETMLELGAGAGHNAYHLKRRFRCTLTDPAPEMLALSRALNPECEHLTGDMRSLRLGRQFDAVLVHDAVMYMTTESDLAAAVATAFLHTRPGGAAVFAPDCLRDTFAETHDLLSGEDEGRAMRGVEWKHDPDPTDSTYRVDYAFLLRSGDDVRVVHDTHIEGLFSIDTWRRLLITAGYEVSMFDRPLDDPGPEGDCDQVFLCQRPA